MTVQAEDPAPKGGAGLSEGLKRLGRTADGQRPAFLELDLPGACTPAPTSLPPTDNVRLPPTPS